MIKLLLIQHTHNFPLDFPKESFEFKSSECFFLKIILNNLDINYRTFCDQWSIVDQNDLFKKNEF